MPESTPSDQQLAKLHSLGMATHFLSPPRDGYTFSITPQQIRELGGIRLTAVLEDGRVIIACPEDVPEVLSSSAVHIDPTVLPETSADDAFEPTSGVDMQTIEAAVAKALDKAMPTPSADLSALEHKLSLLSEAVDRMGNALATQPSDAPEAPDVSLIEQRIIAQGKHLADRLARIDGRLGEMATPEGPDLSAIQTSLDLISQRTDTPTVDFGPVTETLETLANQLTDVLTTAKGGFSYVTERLDTAMGQAQQAVASITGSIDAIPLTDLSQQIAGLSAQIEALPAPMTPTDLHPLLQTGLDRVGQVETTLSDQLGSLTTDGLARQSDISDLKEMLPAPTDLSPMAEQLETQNIALEALKDRLNAALSDIPATTDISGLEADLTMQRDMISALPGIIQAGLDAMPTPEPIDLSDVEQSLARIVAAQNDIAQLETAIEALTEPEDTSTFAAEIVERLAQALPDDKTPDISSRLDQISLRLDASDQSAQIARLIGLMERMAAGPATGGVAVQTLIQQNVSLSGAVARLELIAEAMGKDEDASAQDTQALRDIVDQLMEHQTADESQLSELRSQIDRLMDLPSARVDLAPLDQGIAKMEAVIASLSTYEPPAMDLAPLEACQTALLARVSEMQADRADLVGVQQELQRLGAALASGAIGGDGLANLTTRLEAICDGLTQEDDPANSEDNTTNHLDEFIDDLRFVVAEMFALNLKASDSDVHRLAG